MKATIPTRAAALSQAVYQRLLKAYPQTHRAAYGAAMEQLFRDQCRDAWRKSQSWGLLKLWLRVLPDLVKTSVVERLASLRERKSMIERISEIQRRPFFPFKTFAIVFVVVFALVFGFNAISTLLLPDSFASSARIRVEQSADNNGPGKNAPAGSIYDPYFIQTEFEVIQSEVILSRVVEDLNLNVVWGRKYAGDAKLKTSESVRLLKARLELRPVRNTSLIEIRAFSENWQEAAAIANSVAENYCAYRLAPLRPSSPGGGNVMDKQFNDFDLQIANVQAKLEKVDVALGLANAMPGSQQQTAEQMACAEAGRELFVVRRNLGALQKTIATGYINAQQAKSFPVEIVDRAVPASRPVRPNRPLNIALGVVWGGVIGLVVAGGVAMLAFRILHKPSVNSATL